MLAFMQVRYLPAPTYIFVGKKSLTPVRAVTRAKRNGMPKKLSQRAAAARLPLLRVYRPSDPLVAGVVLDKYRFAIRGRGLLGREVDGIPMDRLGKPAAKHRPFINATTQLVAGAFYGTMAQPCATIVRSRKGAGTVISFGTLPWVRSLRSGNPVAQRITANALRELLPPA
jgi:hypothetical protein